MKRALLLLAILSVLLGIGHTDVGSAPASPHRPLLTGARQDCLLCHLTLPRPDEKTGPETVRSDVDRVCSGCHENIRKFITHKIGVKPLIPIPADFPLDARGQTSCYTCHFIHQRKEKTPFLLRKSVAGKTFCQFCHAEALIWQDIAPTFVAKSLNGGPPVDLAKVIKRKPIVLAFFSYSCFPCIKEMTIVEEIYRKFGPDQVEVVGISTDLAASDETLQDFLEALRPTPTYPVVTDPGTFVVDLYGVKAVPMVVVIDKLGKIRFRMAGFTDDDQAKLSTLLTSLTR